MGGYGIGIQLLAEQSEKLFSVTPLIVQSATANSRSKLEKLQQDLKQAQIILTTSLMQISILDTVGLVLVQNALPLAMPDYNAQLNNYTFLYNLIHSYQAHHIILQVQNTESQIIQSFIQQKPELFLEHDQIFKIKHNYPPHGELCILIYKNQLESSLLSKVSSLFHDMLALKTQLNHKDIEVYAIPANVYKMYSKYRYQIIVK